MGPEFLDSQYLPLDVHWNQSIPPFLPMLHPNNDLDFDFREINESDFFKSVSGRFEPTTPA